MKDIIVWTSLPSGSEGQYMTKKHAYIKDEEKGNRALCSSRLRYWKDDGVPLTGDETRIQLYAGVTCKKCEALANG